MKKYIKYISNVLSILCLFVLNSGMIHAQEYSQPPQEVKNVTAVGERNTIRLTWEKADDPDGVVVGYKVYYGVTSVESEDETYDTELTVGNLTSYTLPDLEYDTEYFVGLTSIDDEGNEAERYSVEVSAKTETLSESSLRVLRAEQTENQKVKVIMSEPVYITASSPTDAFFVEEVETLQENFIKSVEVNGGEVLLTLEKEFVPGKKYQITASSTVENSLGEPVASGITDNTIFTAVDTTLIEENDPEGAPDDVQPTDTSPDSSVSTESFWDKIMNLGKGDDEEDQEESEDEVETTTDPEENTESAPSQSSGSGPTQSDPGNPERPHTTPSNTSGNAGNTASDTITRDFEESNFDISDSEQEDDTGALSNPFGNDAYAEGSHTVAPRDPNDTTPPLDARNVELSADDLEDENVIVLQWEKAPDLYEDITDQILYTRKGIGEWDNGYSLGKNLSEIELEVDLNENYEIRLVTVDSNGNESEGQTFQFSTNLSRTGPGGMGTVVALMVLFFGSLWILGKRRAAY